jgi:aspartyl aminopeptidase
MSHSTLNRALCDFIQASPTPFHAVANMATRLEGAGFSRLDETAAWQLQPGTRYYLTRNQSSLIAFQFDAATLQEQGLRMVGAHTDSPCLKLKPQPDLQRNGYLQLGVEVYGGALLNPWFDRDLSLAGRVTFLDGNKKQGSCLVNFARPIAIIPSLAIHLDREVNQKRSINAQTDLPPLVLQNAPGKEQGFRSLLLAQVNAQHPALDVATILDFELSLYDVNPPALVGLRDEFIAGARLDNLVSCFIGMESLLASAGSGNRLLVCTDHEEVGSNTAAGASGPFLHATLQRLAEKLLGGSNENFQRMLQASFFVSADNAHGIHPNFADKHDSRHGPLLNGGPVIKFNANQRYVTSSESAALFRGLCTEAEVPVQSFVVRSDMACGSTIGPLVAAELGVSTVDIGIPTFAMHSIRELAGSRDTVYLATALSHYFSSGTQAL